MCLVVGRVCVLFGRAGLGWTGGHGRSNISVESAAVALSRWSWCRARFLQLPVDCFRFRIPRWMDVR